MSEAADMAHPQDTNIRQSAFVTVLAWIFIVLGGFATFISLLQNIMINVFFPKAEMRAGMSSARSSGEVPPFFEFIFNNFEWFFAGVFVVSLITLVSAIALLRRRNWARVVFIWLLGFGVVWNLGSIVIGEMMFGTFPADMAGAPASAREEFEAVASFMRIATSIFAIAISGLFVWIIWRLRSKAIVAEFRRLSADSAMQSRAGSHG